jgi:hypothetical protein
MRQASVRDPRRGEIMDQAVQTADSAETIRLASDYALLQVLANDTLTRLPGPEPSGTESAEGRQE